jgi:hypothetical protein
MEKPMPVLIDKMALSSKAPVGTVVGTMTLLDEGAVARRTNYILEEDSAGFFGISGSSIVTLRTPIPVGNYCLNMRLSAQFIRFTDKASFVISVT